MGKMNKAHDATVVLGMIDIERADGKGALLLSEAAESAKHKRNHLNSSPTYRQYNGSSHYKTTGEKKRMPSASRSVSFSQQQKLFTCLQRSAAAMARLLAKQSRD